MAEQDLDSSKVAGLFVDQSGLGPSQRMRTVIFSPKTDAGNPLVDQPGILPGADVSGPIDAAGEGKSYNEPPRLSNRARMLASAGSSNSN